MLPDENAVIVECNENLAHVGDGAEKASRAQNWRRAAKYLVYGALITAAFWASTRRERSHVVLVDEDAV